MSNKVKPKAAAAKYGCLSTRQWQDIRRAARLASSEGITLIMHGVSVIPTTRDSENLSQSENNSTTTSARGGRGLQPKESIGKACENPSAKQLHEQQLTKQQREQERSLRRLHDFQQAFACGARSRAPKCGQLIWSVASPCARRCAPSSCVWCAT